MKSPSLPNNGLLCVYLLFLKYLNETFIISTSSPSNASGMKTVLSWCFQKITCRFPGTLLLCALMLSGVSVYWASGLSFDPRMDNLLPQDLPLIKEFNEVVAKTGGSGPLVVVLEHLNPIEASEVIGKLTQALE